MENKNCDKNVAPVSASQVSTFSGQISKTPSQQSKVISIGGGNKDALHSTPPSVPPRPFKIASTMKSTPISDIIQPGCSKMCSDTQSDAKLVKESPKPFRTHRSNSACVANTTIPAQFASRIARRNTQLLQAVSIVVEPALHHSSKIRSKLDSKCTDLTSKNSGDSMDSGTPPSTPITKHVTLDDLILGKQLKTFSNLLLYDNLNKKFV